MAHFVFAAGSSKHYCHFSRFPVEQESIFLEVVDNVDLFPRGDLQGAVEATVLKIVLEKQL
jgi:hypothetical protein